MGVPFCDTLSCFGITAREATQRIQDFSKAMADVTEAMKPLLPDPLPEAWKNYNMVWTGDANTWAFNAITGRRAEPLIRESDQDPRSEARRWLDHRVSEIADQGRL